MEIKFYNNINKFNEVVFPYFLEREVENNLILAILNVLKTDIHRYGQEFPLLLIITENSTIKLVAIRTPPHDLLISYTNDLNIMEILVNELIQRGEKLPGVLAFKDAADEFKKLWCKKNKLHAKLLRNERVYKLEKVSENVIGVRKFIKGTKTYGPIILNWAREMMREALAERSEKEIEETINFYEKQLNNEKSDFYLLLDKSLPVSMVRRGERTPNGTFINFVYTPPPFRRNGYATECVANISKMILEEGNKYCFLVTDLSNPTSNSLYLKVGYRPVIDNNHYKFR